MKMTPMRALLPALLLSLSTPAFAVYKCEVDGKVSYTDTPCPKGQALDGLGGPSATDIANARRQLAQEKNEAKRLESERHKREAKEEKEQQRAAHAFAYRKQKCDALARRVKWANEDAASGAGKSAMKAKRRAHRLSEQYDTDCPR